MWILFQMILGFSLGQFSIAVDHWYYTAAAEELENNLSFWSTPSFISPEVRLCLTFFLIPLFKELADTSWMEDPFSNTKPSAVRIPYAFPEPAETENTGLSPWLLVVLLNTIQTHYDLEH